MAKRIIYIIFIIFIIISTAIPVLGSHQGAPTRVWYPELTITKIDLTNTSFGPTEYGEYPDVTYEVSITIENTGQVVLTNISLGYKLRRGSTVKMEGMDHSKRKLNISEIYTFTFFWDPNIDQSEWYFIIANVTAYNFGSKIGPYMSQRKVLLRNVEKDIGPIDYTFSEKMSEMGGRYANITQLLIAKVKNFGNFDLSSSFQVSGTIYSIPSLQQIWIDSKTVNDAIPANDYIDVHFSTPWTPPGDGQYLLNLSTVLTGDDKSINDNITTFIEINDTIDAGIIRFKDYESNSVYPNTPITFIAQIKNFGNMNITNSFSAYLSINSYPSGINIFSPSSVQVSAIGPNNISVPGTSVDVIFSTWDYTNNLQEGKYWVNLTIDPVEKNGSSYNNNFSIIIELKNWTNIELHYLTPETGLHYQDDVNNVTIRILNVGTVDINDYTLNLTIENLDTGEIWSNYSTKYIQEFLGWDDKKDVEVLSKWAFKYNAKFKLNVTLTLGSSPKNIIAWNTKFFEISGGKINGTFSGYISDAANDDKLNGIVVSIYTLATIPELINSTISGSDGSYSIDVLSQPGRIDYKVLVGTEDNYWWDNFEQIKRIYSGRTINYNITLTRRPTCQIRGKVQLKAPAGAPAVELDWTGCNIHLEDTPIYATTDPYGAFDFKAVPELVNITAAKDNFLSDTINYVSLIAGINTTIDFTLVEDWGVKVNPVDNATVVGIDDSIIAEFSEKIDLTTISPDSFSLLDTFGEPVSGISRDDYDLLKDDTAVILKPPFELNYTTKYQVLLTTDIKTQSSTSALHRDWVTEFTTEIGLGDAMGYCKFYWSKIPIEGVTVTLHAVVGGQPDRSTETDDNGFFLIENMEMGVYKFKFSYKDYTNQTKKFTILPESNNWVNVTFKDELPVPKLWGYNEQNRKVLITDEMTDLIKVASNFTLTSSIQLDTNTINSNNIKIVEKNGDSSADFKSIKKLNNDLNFELELAEPLNYNTTYQVIYGKDLRTLDSVEIFWKDWVYCNFTTEFSAYRPLPQPIIEPPNNSVNIGINVVIAIDFSLPMNRTSVESLINASFEITAFNWYDNNMTVILEHELFSYFTNYTITLGSGIVSADNVFQLMEPINIHFITITGTASLKIGPVVDTNGKPIPSANVAMLNKTGYKIKSSLTDSKGIAWFYFDLDSWPKPGNYTLKIRKAGYETLIWDFILFEDGLDNDTSIPPLKKIEKPKAAEMDYGLISAAIVIAILIIFLLFFLYLIKFRLGVEDKTGFEGAPGKSKTEKPKGLLGKILGGKKKSKEKIQCRDLKK